MQLHTKPVGSEEFLKAGTNLSGEHLLAGENPNTGMIHIASLGFDLGEHIPSDEILARIDSPSYHDLQRFAFARPSR